ncbi:tRNA adenosine deaminase-associated protein [Nocardioides limicola]|uniref:tRNA adenosine deaminase-associated protein n=1 Tax=Nocardioides limicola TaxID=2803368 RepID=UPI0027DD1871|nr:tRNA adenosine deaminase-associated protein [Nocardioides sp. DJM-14]
MGAVAGQTDSIDFALAAYREEGQWQVAEIAEHFCEELGAVVTGLRRFPGDGGALGLIGIDEDFFLLVRVTGSQVHVLLSDVTAAEEWELAREAVQLLDLPMPEDEDEQAPAGDLGILADAGVTAIDMGVLLDDYDLYPDEALSEIARRVGFGDLFDDAVGLTSA